MFLTELSYLFEGQPAILIQIYLILNQINKLVFIFWAHCVDKLHLGSHVRFLCHGLKFDLTKAIKVFLIKHLEELQPLLAIFIRIFIILFRERYLEHLLLLELLLQLFFVYLFNGLRGLQANHHCRFSLELRDSTNTVRRFRRILT